MSAKVIKSMVVGCVAAVTGGVWGAEWLGTGGDSRFGTGANWEGGQVPTENLVFSDQAGDNKTVMLDGDYTFGGSASLSGGTADAPFVFAATDEGGGGTNSLSQTTAGNFSLKGALKVESGIWNFANDIQLSGSGFLHLVGGRTTTKYWIPATDSARIEIDGGELVLGYRDGGEQSNGRLNMQGNAALVMRGGRLRCANNTNGGNDSEALTIGENAGAASVDVSGGELVANGKIHLGMSSGSSSTLSVSGSGVVSSSNDMRLGYGGATSKLEISDRGEVHVGSADNVRWLYLDGGDCTLRLNGGVLQTGRINIPSGAAPTVRIEIDGGTLQPTGTDDAFISSYANQTVTIGEQGGTLDCDFATTIAAEIGGAGALVKTGKGDLTLAGATSYTGATIVRQGVLKVAAGHAFAGAVEIGSSGAIAVDVSSAIDAGTVAVGDEIDLFTAKGDIAFAYEDDVLEEAIFLYGPVVEYTLRKESGEDGTAKIVATIAGVDNAASTRKVTTFIATDNYIDQNASWSNGQPVDKSHDITVFCADATMNVYAANWGAGNNRACAVMAIRGATVLAQHPNNWNPCLDKNRIVGHGILQLRRLGLEKRNAPGDDLVVSTGITVQIVRTSANSDTWITPCTINGNLEVTTGYTVFNSDAIVNGNVRFSNPEKNSYITSSSATGNQFNGDFTVDKDCRFDFKSAVVVFGPDSRLILNGGTIANYDNVESFAQVVVADGLYYYRDLPPVSAGTYSLTGGRIVMSAAEAEDASAAVGVAVSGGTIVVDGSAVEDLAAGSTISLAAVTFADGTTPSVQVVGTQFDWSLSDDGKTVTAAVPADSANVWIGGAEGAWNESANWKYGIPAANGVARFDSDALCRIEASKTISNLVVSAGATVLLKCSAGNPTIYLKEVSGEGRLCFYHVGIEANGSPGTVAETLTLEYVSTESDGSDSWLKGNPVELAVYAPVTGAGYLRVYDKVRFYGDNSGFTGYFRKDNVDARFMTPESGLPNATKVDINGTLWLWFAEGEFALGGNVTMTSSDNRGINMPAEAAVGKGMTLTLGGGDGTIAMAMSTGKPYQAYTQNGSDWTEGCDRFTIRKIGAGAFANGMSSLYNLVCEDGVTTFTQSSETASVEVKVGATIASTSDLALGAAKFEPGAQIAFNPDATITVSSDVDVTGVVLAIDDELKAELAAKSETIVDPCRYAVLTATGKVSGDPAECELLVPDDPKPNYHWIARVRNNTFEYVRRVVNSGLMIILR
ncbi:MAG: autotransporter-associated beta strand repeat-containing protein [Kiritimatiellia bacterium]